MTERPLTPENLREAARSIDLMQRAIVKILNAYQLRLTRDGAVLEHEEALLLDFLTGTEVQDSMRAWAGELEARDG